MKPMNKLASLSWPAAVFALLFIFAVRSGVAGAPQEPADPAGDAPALVARGEYIANKASMCVQCHSGRDTHGEIIESEKFRGGAIPFKSPYGGTQWADRAPNISGLPGFTDDQIIALLTTGQATDRDPPRRPMPPFRMTPEDARAVVAYLRSR
jgi:mono/diheme cytochrome c family protein